MATLSDIEERIQKLHARAQAIRKKQITAVVTKIHSLMKVHGLTVADLGTPRTVSRKQVSATDDSAGAPTAMLPKYRDPKTGATWSGRGRAPNWIARAKNRAKFLASGAVQPGDSSPNKRTGNYPRGPQPAKYRDPKTGAEWSGRGKAPGWLAAVKNKSKFLISASNSGAAPIQKNETVSRATPARAARPAKVTNAQKTSRAKR